MLAELKLNACLLILQASAIWHSSSTQTVDQPSSPASDADVLAYMQRQLRSGRVKPSVLVSLTQKTFADVSHERIVQCFNQLDSGLLKR
jgi:hypothetical protein